MSKITETTAHLTSEQRESHKAIRERFRHERPSPDELIEQGELDELVPQGQFMELARLVGQIKRERERKGLSLTDVSEASGLTRPAISRIENGWNVNPTLDTLFRYAAAVGLHIGMAASEQTRSRATEMNMFIVKTNEPIED
jgi:DNA-binding XRE family transcriptional regulator